ncbi:MAG: hypothetical protein RL199_1721 [Pseudomonadota bacterium]
MSLIAHWFFAAAAFLLASRLLEPSFRVIGGFGSALVVAVVFGVLSVLFGWLVFGLLGLMTFGVGFLLGFLTRLVTAALMLLLTAAVTERLEVRGFGTAVLAAVVIGVVTSVGEWLVDR